MIPQKENYNRLLTDYKEQEKHLLYIKAQKEVAQKALLEVEDKLKKLLKQSTLDGVEATLNKLANELGTKISCLSEKIREFEGLISEFKIENIEEDTKDSFFEGL